MGTPAARARSAKARNRSSLAAGSAKSQSPSSSTASAKALERRRARVRPTRRLVRWQGPEAVGGREDLDVERALPATRMRTDGIDQLPRAVRVHMRELAV